ncbi:MAG TPA: hypothetical protein VMK12_27250, partial [Anaeromyxobacteraceae bacterium]|nr:hypothetical protein [Anaeromyxobacteraceae bacterium]
MAKRLRGAAAARNCRYCQNTLATDGDACPECSRAGLDVPSVEYVADRLRALEEDEHEARRQHDWEPADSAEAAAEADE